MGVYQRKLKSGIKWRYDGSYQGKHYTSPAHFESQEEAKKEERQYLAELKGDTLSALIRSRLNYMKIRQVNRDYYKNTVFNLGLAEDFWGSERLLKQITKRDAYDLFEKVATDWQEQGYTSHPANKFIRCMKSFFYWAEITKDIDMKNPFQKMPLLPIITNRKHIPTEAQIYKVWSKLKGQSQDLFRFVEETGCRIDEAIKLDVKDLENGSIILWTKKAKNSNLTPRVIPRPDWFVKIPGEGRVFTEWNSYPRFLGELVTEMKHRPHWNWHNLRHRRASIWARDNMPTYELMSRLGHSNLSTTMGYLQQLGYNRL